MIVPLDAQALFDVITVLHELMSSGSPEEFTR
jgi:hypothetical protein